MKHLLVLITSLILSFGSNAQDFEVAPVMVNFQVEPGNNESRKVSITNHSDKTQLFNLKLSDYEHDSLGNTIRMGAGESSRSLVDYLSISPSIVELPPNGAGTADLILTIPNNEYGSKWGIIYVEAAREKMAMDIDETMATGIIISPRIAIFVNQSPKSNRNLKAKILKIYETTDPKQTNRSFEVVVQNLGEKLIKADLEILIANMNTGEETKLQTKSESIHPGVKKRIPFSIDSLEKGKYALAVIMDYGNKANIEGAQLVITQE